MYIYIIGVLCVRVIRVWFIVDVCHVLILSLCYHQWFVVGEPSDHGTVFFF